MDGKLLKKLREELNMTQKELADRVQVTPKAISFYELNQREPSNELLVEFSKIFNVSTDYLLGNHINNLNILSKRIKYLREEKGLSQKELANYLNISNSTLSQYESGVRVPSDEIKIKLAKYFNVTTDYLLGNSNVKNTSLKKDDNLEEEFPEGLKMLRRANKELTEEGKKKMLEMAQLFIDSLEKKDKE